MVTHVGTEADVDDLVEDLIKLDFAAIEAYDAAVERLSNAEYKRKLAEFRNDHQEHTRVLGAWMRQHGHNPPDGGGAKELLTSGKVVLASLAGDKRILQAMKTNEDDTNTAYERAVNHENVDDDLRGVFEKNLSDERRHRAWIETTLASL
jgi:rubrerythrin